MKRHTHGNKGAFVGGGWVPLEKCDAQFNIPNGSAGDFKGGCPRSRTRHSAAKEDGSYDVVIIGAGCIGSAIARELSRTTASVLVLEAADDVTQGATKGNSGIVHAGYDDKPGSVRAKFCWPGNQMFSQLDHELHFGYDMNGSLVVACNEAEEEHLRDLSERGKKNGVKNLKIVGQKKLREMEPHINPACTAALYSPDAGTVIPYEFAIALAENAADNGVEFRIRREVQSIEVSPEGFSISARHWEPASYSSSSLGAQIAAGTAPFVAASAVLAASPNTFSAANLYAVALGAGALFFTFMNRGMMSGLEKSQGTGGKPVEVETMATGGTGSSKSQKTVTQSIEIVKTRYIVNCAGCASDKIANMIGDFSFKVKPRIGDYILLNKNQGHLANATLFPCPGKFGKGVLVQHTLWGNLILGPTARDVHDPKKLNQPKEEIMGEILAKCRKLVPEFDATQTIHTFNGARAKTDRGDWIVEPSKKSANFVHAAGIDSPGLAGSPAIALEIVNLLKQAGLNFDADPSFNPNRAPIIIPKNGFKGLKMGPDGKERDPRKNVVCKCEKVTEQEVVTALRRSLPIDSTQGIRKRTRAGMGHCQGDDGNYQCECRVAKIIARENKLAAAKVGRRPWPGTSLLPQRWLAESQKKELDALSW